MAGFNISDNLIVKNGSIGIGVSDPSEKLHVDGRIVTGGLYGTGHTGSILPVWQYNSGNPGFGIGYEESSPDKLRMDVTGQLMSGTPDFELVPNELRINGNKVWNAGNDGSGSGLDADTVDGKQASNLIWDNGTTRIGNMNTLDAQSAKYSWNNATTGRPASSQSNEYGAMLHLNYDGGYAFQQAWDIDQGNLYVRTLNYSSDSGSWSKVWHSGNDGGSSGLDADTVDGIQGSSFLRSDAADTATGTITFSSGINVGDISNGGITGNNYNITGVNNITMNDPGEGISFAGTANVQLYAIESSDSIMNFSNATELRRDNNKVWDAGNDGSGSGLDADLLDGQHGSYYTGAKGVNQNYVASSTSTSNRGNYGAGVWAYSGYSGGSNRPFTYDATLQVMPNSGRGFEISVDWVSQTSTPIKIRSLRDCCQGWSDYSTVWTSTSDGSGSGLDADTVDGIQGGSFLRSDASDTGSGEYTLTNKKQKIGESTNWDAIGFGNQTNLHFQGHNNFWVGAGNGTWFAGSANSKSASSGLAADASKAHDLLIATMYSDSTHDRGISFAVDSNGAGTAGWRLGKWHSGDAQDASKLVIDGQFFAKGGRHTSEYDYYGNDYSAYYSSGNAHWAGDSGQGWHYPAIVASAALQIQSGNYGTSTLKPQIQFHQYGYGGPKIEYDGPGDFLNITGPSSRLNTTSGVRINNNKIWHAGNDGSGTGLDADTLDGQHASSFASSTPAATLNIYNSSGTVVKTIRGI